MQRRDEAEPDLFPTPRQHIVRFFDACAAKHGELLEVHMRQCINRLEKIGVVYYGMPEKRINEIARLVARQFRRRRAMDLDYVTKAYVKDAIRMQINHVGMQYISANNYRLGLTLGLDRDDIYRCHNAVWYAILYEKHAILSWFGGLDGLAEAVIRSLAACRPILGGYAMQDEALVRLAYVYVITGYDVAYIARHALDIIGDHKMFHSSNRTLTKGRLAYKLVKKYNPEDTTPKRVASVYSLMLAAPSISKKSLRRILVTMTTKEIERAHQRIAMIGGKKWAKQ